MDISPCTAQTQVMDHSFTFLEKFGLFIGYEIQYVIASGDSLNDAQKQKLFPQTSKIASAYGRELALVDFMYKRDSIETHFINDVINQMARYQIEIKEIKIINLLIPTQIEKALIDRATLFKEPLPTRVKSY